MRKIYANSSWKLVTSVQRCFFVEYTDAYYLIASRATHEALFLDGPPVIPLCVHLSLLLFHSLPLNALQLAPDIHIIQLASLGFQSLPITKVQLNFIPLMHDRILSFLLVMKHSLFCRVQRQYNTYLLQMPANACNKILIWKSMNHRFS